MPEERRQQLKNRTEEAYKILKGVEQTLITSRDPKEMARMELYQAHLLRVIEQFQLWLAELNMGQNVPDPSQVSLNPEAAAPPTNNSASDEMPPNPFNRIGIVTQQWFVGRTTQMRRIQDAIDKNNSIILVGPPKIGKTCLIRHFLAVKPAPGRQVLMIDFKMDKPISYHYSELLRRLRKTGDTIQEVEKAVRGKKILLFIDEFELAPDRKLDVKELLAFKSLVEAPKSGFQVIAISSKPAFEIYSGSFGGSTPYSFFTEERLKVFSKVETDKFFDAYLGQAASLFRSEIRQELFELTEGHPYKLQKAAYRYYEWLTDQDPADNWRNEYEEDIKVLD